MKGDDEMRYESFYPFSQTRANEFFNINGSPPVNSPPPSPNTFGMPGNQPNNPSQNFFGNPSNPASSQPNNFLGRLQQGILGSFQQGGPGNDGGFGGQGGIGGPEGFGGQGGFQQAPQSSKTMSYLQTADKFLNTAQQITPMVRQYAPMFQNVPALWKLYRGFQSIPSATAASTVGAAVRAPSIARATTSIVSSGASLPRIFQPPI